MTLVYPRIRSFARRSLGMRSGAHSHRVLDIDGREPLDLVPAECYLDELADAFHGADRNRHRLLAPQVSLIEQDVGHVVVAGIDHEPLDLPDRPVGGRHVLAAAHVDIAQRNLGIGDLTGTKPVVETGSGRAGYGHAMAGIPEVGQPDRLPGRVTRPFPDAGQELVLLRRLERFELGLAALQPDFLRGGAGHERDRYEMATVPAVLRLDVQVGDRVGDRIDDHATEDPAAAVAAPHITANNELLGLTHERDVRLHGWGCRNGRVRSDPAPRPA